MRLEGVERHKGSQIGAEDLRQVYGIYSKTVICIGQRHMETIRDRKKESIMEAVNWVCADVQDDQDRVSQ